MMEHRPAGLWRGEGHDLQALSKYALAFSAGLPTIPAPLPDPLAPAP